MWGAFLKNYKYACTLNCIRFFYHELIKIVNRHELRFLKPVCERKLNLQNIQETYVHKPTTIKSIVKSGNVSVLKALVNTQNQAELLVLA